MSPPSGTPLTPELGQFVQALADRFEAGWQAGAPPALEALLAEAPDEARPELFRRLVRIESDWRRRQGRPLTAEEALRRFTPVGPWAGALLASLGLERRAACLALEVVGGPRAGRSFELAGHSSCVVGSGRGGAAVHLAIDDDGLSRVHFLVEYNPPRARLADLRSKNGTWVNGRRVDQADLADGDTIRAGRTTLRVRLPQGPATVTLGPAEPSCPSTMPPAGSLPGYDLLEERGRGGMGVVYKARRRADGAVVAVKTVLPAVTPHAAALARFEREIVILRKLAHPHIVRFLDASEANGLLYFVMEYIDGPSAATLVKDEGPLDLPRAVELGRQLLDALGHAHAQGLVHRDVKPGNILLDRAAGRPVLRLADFGLARAYQESALSGLTLAGTPGGTPGFMPPEQVLDFHSARPAADQYGAAATLYFLLTGRAIYEPAANQAELLLNVLENEPLPRRRPPAGPPLPARVGDVLCRALERDPARRFAGVLEMREALLRAV